MVPKQAKEKCIKLLQQYTGHDIIKITSSGDAAIFGALFIAKQHGYNHVLIPDQGGWLTYKTFPKILDMSITELKTEYGIIDPKTLQDHKNCVLLYASYAGYFALQDIAALYKTAQQYNIFVILDASGALSHETLSNGNFADIIVASFGKWKIADLGYGGFLSSKMLSKDIKASDIFKLTKASVINYEQLLQKLKKAPQRLNYILKKAQEVKQQCKKKAFTILHENKEGLNVIISYANEKEKQDVIDFCNSHMLAYKECPLYIKVLEKAISIEVKRDKCD